MAENKNNPHRLCCLIAAFNEERTVADVILASKKHIPNVILIDDGSIDNTYEIARGCGAHVIRHPKNMGKGRALKTGFDHALGAGFHAAVTLDADGQHDPEEIPSFMDAHDKNLGDIIIGNRMSEAASMPLRRYIGNRIGVFFISRAAGVDIPDSQTGFRLYSADAMRLQMRHDGFEAETEILIRAARRGYRIAPVKIKTIYPKEYKSHFRAVRDFYRISTVVMKNYD